MAVIIGGFKQETNSFCNVPMTLSNFQNGYLHIGEALTRNLAGTSTGFAGFIEVLKKHDKKILPTIAANASASGGAVTADAYHYLRDALLEKIKGYQETETIEAVLLNMHGAMISEDCEDVEGTVVEQVRQIIGKDVPIGISLDGHAFVSERLLANADIIVGYARFPHVDEKETGRKAAELVMKMLQKELRPVTSAVALPMLLSPEAQLDREYPLGDILTMCREYEKMEEIASITFFPVQPWMDIAHLVSRVIVITNDAATKGNEIARKIGRKAWSLRKAFTPVHVTPCEAVRKAMKSDKTFTVLSEVGDAPPAGATGDSNILLKALLEEELTGPAYVTITDPQAVEAAYRAGIGGQVKTRVGYALDPRWGEPIEITGEVMKLVDDGGFIHELTDTPMKMGKTALIKIGHIVLIVCEEIFCNMDPNSYTVYGLDLNKAKIVGVKSTQHFRALYAPIAGDIHLLETPGASSSNFSELPWSRLTRPMWPLDDMDDFEI